MINKLLNTLKLRQYNNMEILKVSDDRRAIIGFLLDKKTSVRIKKWDSSKYRL